MALARQIMEGLKSQIATTIDGTGSYVYDVTGSDQVVISKTFQPERIPGVYIFFDGVPSRQTAGSTVLSKYDRTVRVQIEGWCPTDSSAPGEAALDALDFAEDIRRAVESDRAIGLYASGVRDVNVDIRLLTGQGLDVPGLALCVLSVDIAYSETAGN